MHPSIDPFTGALSCAIDGRMDLVPDVFEVVVEARRSYMEHHGEEPTDLGLGADRLQEADRIARVDFGTDLSWGDTPTLFGMRLHTDERLQPDAVLVGRYVNGKWDLGVTR